MAAPFCVRSACSSAVVCASITARPGNTKLRKPVLAPRSSGPPRSRNFPARSSERTQALRRGGGRANAPSRMSRTCFHCWAPEVESTARETIIIDATVVAKVEKVMTIDPFPTHSVIHREFGHLSFALHLAQQPKPSRRPVPPHEAVSATDNPPKNRSSTTLLWIGSSSESASNASSSAINSTARP